ncbi:MAG: TetR/AcrR family transcriptional regulator [Myxococcota bacterium]
MTANLASLPKRGRPSRREPIFESALRLFRERGFHATSINEIGADANVTGPAIYAHFASKGGVLAEAIREGCRRISDALNESLADDDLSADEALEKLVRAYVRVALENADMTACYVLELRHVDAEQRGPLQRAARHLCDLWREKLTAVRPELGREQADTMVQMAIFSIVSLCMMPSRIDRQSLIELASQQVMHGLLGTDPIPTRV